jgi:phage gpG-like protein
MSELKIEISKTDLQKLTRLQERIPHLIEDPRLKKSIGQLLAAQAKRNINEQSPDGSSTYKALLPKTVRQKGFATVLIGRKADTTTKKGRTNNSGVNSGVLRKSIDFELGSRDIIYLTAINYAKYHQFGTKDLPVRPIFTIRRENTQDIMRFFKNAFNRIIKENS